MSERAGRQRYFYSAWLQFAILGGLLAALASRFARPIVGWRWLFAASIVPVAILSFFRWRWLTGPEERKIPVASAMAPESAGAGSDWEDGSGSGRLPAFVFFQCLALASLTIASGYINVFYVKELPQSLTYTILFWANAAPGMLLGAAIVRRLGVRRAVVIYATALIALSLLAWAKWLPGGKLAFALMLPVLNGIPFGLMGAYFNEVFAAYRTMLSGGAYNLGRILAGFAPLVITAWGLQTGEHYFLFSAGLGVGVLLIGMSLNNSGAVTADVRRAGRGSKPANARP
jgi:putative MFS transporter